MVNLYAQIHPLQPHKNALISRGLACMEKAFSFTFPGSAIAVFFFHQPTVFCTQDHFLGVQPLLVGVKTKTIPMKPKVSMADIRSEIPPLLSCSDAVLQSLSAAIAGIHLSKNQNIQGWHFQTLPLT